MERRLAAVMAADVVGYSQLMEADEEGALSHLTQVFSGVVAPELERAHGRIVKTTGDGFLAEFPSVVDAVHCAMAVQQSIPEGPIRYRIGINIGDIILQQGDIYGDGVNVAARLEAIAPPGGMCVSDLVWQNLRGDLGGRFQDAGAQQFKNINRRIRAWRWPAEEGGAARHADETPDKAVTLVLTQPDHAAQDGAAGDFAAGIVNDLRVSFGKLDTLRLVRGSAAGKARYEVSGNVRSAGERIRCNMELRDPAIDTILWTDRFDGRLDDLFDFQDRITEAVASAVEIEISEGPQVRRWRAEAGSVAAYELFREGRAAYKTYARTDNARAQQLFRRALDVSPGFLSASVGLARTHIEEAHFLWSEDKQASLDRAREIIDGVLSIDPEHSGAIAERAHYLMLSGEFDDGLLAGELAVALDPNDADAYNCLSYLQNCNGRFEDALVSSRRALSLNPSAPEFYLLPMAQAFAALARYDEAAGLSQRILDARPNWMTTHALKVIALEGAGRHEAAVEAVAEMQRINPRFTIAVWESFLTNFVGQLVPAGALLRKAGLPD